MEGFFEDRVKQVLNISSEVRVVALLAVGKRKGNEVKARGNTDVPPWNTGNPTRGIDSDS